MIKYQRSTGLYALSSDYKTSKNRTMSPARIQIPDDVLRMTSPGFRRTIFTTKKAEERSRLESEDRKAKLEIRAHRRAEAGSRFCEELEKSDGVVTVGDFLLRKLAAQENTLKGLYGEGKNSREMVDQGEGQEHLERIKRETVEALILMRDL
jgi:hypothetical protein